MSFLYVLTRFYLTEKLILTDIYQLSAFLFENMRRQLIRFLFPILCFPFLESFHPSCCFPLFSMEEEIQQTSSVYNILYIHP